MSFPNGLVTILVGLIYDPRDVTITCAQGRASLDGLRQLNVAKNATAAEQQATFNAAAELSARIHQPVVVRF